MLLDYHMEEFQALNADGWGYLLKICDETFWGLIKRTYKVKVLIPHHFDVVAFYEPKLNVWNK